MESSRGFPAEITSVTATVCAPFCAFDAATVTVPVYVPGSSRSMVGLSTVTSIGTDEPESATPLVVRLARLFCPTLSHTGDVVVDFVDEPPAVTLNGITSPLDETLMVAFAGAVAASPVV